MSRERQSLSKENNLCGLPHRPWAILVVQQVLYIISVGGIPSMNSRQKSHCVQYFNQPWPHGFNCKLPNKPAIWYVWRNPSKKNTTVFRFFSRLSSSVVSRIRIVFFVTMMWMDPKTVWPINLDIVEAGAKQDIATKDTNNNLHLKPPSHLNEKDSRVHSRDVWNTCFATYSFWRDLPISCVCFLK